MNEIIESSETEKQIDDLLIEEENVIRQVGVQSIWTIGEQLEIAKLKVIHVTGNKYYPGFLGWALDKFNFKKRTVNRYIRAYKDKEEDIKKIWGHDKSGTLATQINEYKIYNIWNLLPGDKDYFGHFPSMYMKNLLHKHTDENDLVYDPFAGAGTTIDICKEMNRQYYCSDLNPQRDDISQWDIGMGLPSDLPKIDFVFLDPPYWIQAEGMYSEDKCDLGNMALEDFYMNMEYLLDELKRVQAPRIAIVIQGTQYKNNMHYEDHFAEFHTMLYKKYKIEMRYILPYSTQQYNAQMVIRAKEENKCLVLHRDLTIWRII